MRSELVFVAATFISNRYLLTLVASKATRGMHRPDARLEDTSNVVLQILRPHESDRWRYPFVPPSPSNRGRARSGSAVFRSGLTQAKSREPPTYSIAQTI